MGGREALGREAWEGGRERERKGRRERERERERDGDGACMRVCMDLFALPP